MVRRRGRLHDLRHGEIVHGGQARADETRVCKLHPHPRAAQIGMQRFRQRHAARLGRAIAHRPRQPPKARERPGDDQMPLPARDHAGQHCPDHPRAAGEVDVAHRLDLIGVPVLRAHGPIDARQPDQTIDRPDGFGHLADVFAVGYVHRGDLGPQGGRDLGQAVGIAGRQHQPRPTRSHALRQCRAQPL